MRRSPRSRRSPLTVVALMIGVVIAGTVAVAPDSTDAALPTKTIIDSAPRPLGPVTVIGDSVLLGSLYNSPTIVARLAEQGFGPIRAQAGGGYSTGAFPVTTSYRASYWIQRWRSEGWDPPNVLVNLGANDSGFCGTNATCAYDAIMHLVNAIGPGHRIWWPMVTRGGYNVVQGTTWNSALARVASERDDFFTWDWPTVMANGPFPSSDNTHLSPDGYRLRSQLMAHEFTADVARAQRTGGDAPLPTPIGSPAEYVPLTPARVLDTRFDPPGRLAAGGTLTVDMTPHVPDGATAVAVNLTSARTATGGFLSAHPCDRTRRDVSSVNHAAGQARGALAIVPLSSDGVLCVYTKSAGDVVVDLQGAFVPDGGTRLTTVDADRLLDTRDTGRAELLEIDVPDPTVAAVAVNLTAARGGRVGFLTADACGAVPPDVSNLNFLPDEPVAGAAIVPVSDDGTICVRTSAPVDVIVDLTGEFRTDSGLRFQAADPSRMLDLRDGTGGWAPILGAGQLVDARVAPSNAAAVTGTITLVRPLRTGFAVADCRDDPPTSNVNAAAGDAMANALTVALADEGDLCFRSSAAAKLLFDTTGWWIP